jgi:hypothetical protein
VGKVGIYLFTFCKTSPTPPKMSKQGVWLPHFLLFSLYIISNYIIINELVLSDEWGNAFPTVFLSYWN